jgi:hypothetical protein
LTKSEAEQKSLPWKDLKEKTYKPTVLPFAVTEDPEQAKDNITEEKIGCMNEGGGDHNCTVAFRILPNELQFYRQNQIPLPVYCPNCRHHQRMLQRNPMKLWDRNCQCSGEQSENGKYNNTVKHIHDGKCSNFFETTYASDRPEIIYCEKCYQQEVY